MSIRDTRSNAPPLLCRVCGVTIQPPTAARTGFLCMPCKGRSLTLAQQLAPPRQIEIQCQVSNHYGSPVTFSARPENLLAYLKGMTPEGGASHPNHLEVQAQIALLQFCLSEGVGMTLHNDHWDRTGVALIALFEQGKAAMLLNGQRYSAEDIVKQSWDDDFGGTDRFGGFCYETPSGDHLFQRITWTATDGNPRVPVVYALGAILSQSPPANVE